MQCNLDTTTHLINTLTDVRGLVGTHTDIRYTHTHKHTHIHYLLLLLPNHFIRLLVCSSQLIASQIIYVINF